MSIGADKTGKLPLRCLLLLHSSLTPLPGQWVHCQSCKYTLGATLVIISQIFLIAHYKSFGRVTIASHNIKHVLWHAIAARVVFYSWPGLSKSSKCWYKRVCVHIFDNFNRSGRTCQTYEVSPKLFQCVSSFFNEKWIKYIHTTMSKWRLFFQSVFFPFLWAFCRLHILKSPFLLLSFLASPNIQRIYFHSEWYFFHCV